MPERLRWIRLKSLKEIICEGYSRGIIWETIFFYLKFEKYSEMILNLNSKFISTRMMMYETSNSSDSRMFDSSFSLTSRDKASDTMCCLSDLCLMMRLNRWIYSKTRISRRFNLSMKLIIRDVCLAILNAVSWFVNRIVDFLKDSIIWRIFLMMKTMSAIFNWID